MTRDFFRKTRRVHRPTSVSRNRTRSPLYSRSSEPIHIGETVQDQEGTRSDRRDTSPRLRQTRSDRESHLHSEDGERVWVTDMDTTQDGCPLLRLGRLRGRQRRYQTTDYLQPSKWSWTNSSNRNGWNYGSMSCRSSSSWLWLSRYGQFPPSQHLWTGPVVTKGRSWRWTSTLGEVGGDRTWKKGWERLKA